MLAKRHIDLLRKRIKTLTEARRSRDTEATHRATAAYTDALEWYSQWPESKNILHVYFLAEPPRVPQENKHEGGS